MTGRPVNYKLNEGYAKALYEAIAGINDPDECKAFLEDICSMNEIISLSQRLEVARLLRQKRTYIDIAAMTGASTATISRVNRSLNYGNGSIDKVLK